MGLPKARRVKVGDGYHFTPVVWVRGKQEGDRRKLLPSFAFSMVLKLTGPDARAQSKMMIGGPRPSCIFRYWACVDAGGKGEGGSLGPGGGFPDEVSECATVQQLTMAYRLSCDVPSTSSAPKESIRQEAMNDFPTLPVGYRFGSVSVGIGCEGWQ